MEAESKLHASTQDSAETRINAAFARAMAMRGTSQGLGNLYDGALGPSEMLAAFDALVTQTPLVRFGHYAANAAILDMAGGASYLHLVDIGLGSGAQWFDFVDQVAASRGPSLHVHLTGIDLPAPGDDPAADLQAAGQRLSAYAGQKGVSFSFAACPGAIETVELPVATDEGPLVFNAAFALHHTASADAVTEGVVSRDHVLARIRGTGARGLVLVEPESNHDTPDTAVRLAAARHHYGLLFHVLERCLANLPGPRSTIEDAFFGREIINVVCGEGRDRVERHSPQSDWIRRLQDVGFRQVSCADHSEAIAARLVLPNGVRITRHGLSVGLWVDGHLLAHTTAWN